MLRKWILLGGLLTAPALLVGCNSGQPPAEPATAPTPKPDDHGHKPGAHGGILVSLGKDSYHAEAVFASRSS